VTARGRPSSKSRRIGDDAIAAFSSTVSVRAGGACDDSIARGSTRKVRNAAGRKSAAATSETTFTVVDDWSDPIPVAGGELNALETFLMGEFRRFLPRNGSKGPE
jgi:hypothetical protein